jgi:hypothetical protein
MMAVTPPHDRCHGWLCKKMIGKNACLHGFGKSTTLGEGIKSKYFLVMIQRINLKKMLP